MNASLPAVLGFPHAAPPPPAEVIEVARGVLWLRMPLPFALDHINLWLLADGDGWTQVDCGYGDIATRTLWEAHFETTLTGRPLARVVATHYHPDHLGNAAWLTERFKCPLVMPQAEFLTAHLVGTAHAGYGAESICALFRAHGMSREHLASMQERGNRYRSGVPELPPTFRRLLAGDEIEIGANRWRAIGGYGHSPEHVSLYCTELEAAADEPRTAAELVPVLFRRELDLQQRFFAMGEAIAHLNYLWHAGRFTRTIDANGTIHFQRANAIVTGGSKQ